MATCKFEFGSDLDMFEREPLANQRPAWRSIDCNIVHFASTLIFARAYAPASSTLNHVGSGLSLQGLCSSCDCPEHESKAERGCLQFLVPNPLMPKAWLWMNYISATTWVIYGLSASQLGEETDPIVAPGTRLCAAVPFGHVYRHCLGSHRVRMLCA